MLNKKGENVSTVMLLPVVKINKKLMFNFYRFGFKNTYLFSEQLDCLYDFNTIYLLFEPNKLDIEFAEFIFELSSNPNFIEVKDVGFKKMILVFKIPDQFKRDFKLFLEGQYSKVTDTYKKCFQLEKPSKTERGDIKREPTGSIIMEPTTFFHIFNKSDKLRNIYIEKLGLDDFKWPEELELYDKVNIEKETIKDLILF